jgi:hypothetical protein
MIANIQPIEDGGQHWVDVVWDDGEPRRHGPFANADMAEAMAGRLAAACRVMCSEVHMPTAAHNR